MQFFCSGLGTGAINSSENLFPPTTGLQMVTRFRRKKCIFLFFLNDPVAGVRRHVCAFFFAIIR